MSLSIIIVNFKTAGLLSDCLLSVFTQTQNIDLEIIVVDNASGDDSRSVILESFPAVKWIQMDYNAGFARANNEGIRQSSGDVVLLLNSDTLNVDDSIGKCYAAFGKSEYIACGVQLLNADGSPQISGNYFMIGGLNNLLPLPYTGNFIKWIGNVLKVKKPNIPDAQTLVEVDWINGAFLMVKKTAIENVGLMDEDFFLYAEEAEWCNRLGKTGKLCIYGQFKIIHLQGATANTAFASSGQGYYNLYDRKGLQIMLSNFVRIRKQFGIGWFLLQLLIYTFTVPIYFVFDIFRNAATGKNPFQHFRTAGGFLNNVVQLWRFSAIVIRNKPFFYKVL